MGPQITGVFSLLNGYQVFKRRERERERKPTQRCTMFLIYLFGIQFLSHRLPTSSERWAQHSSRSPAIITTNLRPFSGIHFHYVRPMTFLAVRSQFIHISIGFDAPLFYYACLNNQCSFYVIFYTNFSQSVVFEDMWLCILVEEIHSKRVVLLIASNFETKIYRCCFVHLFSLSYLHIRISDLCLPHFWRIPSIFFLMVFIHFN